MKSKGMRLVLVVAVVLVWGLVLRRLFFVLPAASVSVPAPGPEKKESPEREFVLKASYRDPFLGEDSVLPAASVDKIPAQLPTPLEQKVPFLEYRGKIRKGKDVYAVIFWEEEERIIREGDTIGGLRMMKVWNDSLLAVSFSARYIFPLQ